MNWKFLLCIFSSLIMMACGDLEAGSEQLNGDSGVLADMICDPGRQLECACVGGQKGAQVCSIDGTHYLACQCPTVPDSGNDVQADVLIETGTETDAGNDAQQMAELEVALAQDTPPGATLCQNASDVSVFSFTLASSTQNAITKGIRIQRVGVGPTSDIVELRLELSNVYFTGTLVDQTNGIWYFDSPGISTQVGNPTKLVLHANFKGTPGSQHAFQIKDATALDMITPANVTGIFPVQSNIFTLASASCGGLSVTLAAKPISGTAAKNSQNVDVLGIEFSAGANDIQLKSIPLRCQASINGAPFATTDCYKRITSLTVFEGSTQLGSAMSPNTDGKAPILTDYVIPKGAPKTFTVKATFASVASASEPYDKVSIGLDNMIATDLVYNQNVTADIQAPLATQLSQTPTVAMTIHHVSAAYCDPLDWDPQKAYLGCCGTFLKVNPSDLKAGDLIKASGIHSVYYFGSDGKRYLFPTSIELDSWYAPTDYTYLPAHDYNQICLNALEITEQQLVNIALGAQQVTKRPGAYITGITTDPKRYVVDTHRVLREASPQLLEAIYGGPVETRTFLTPDAFFVNYLMGASLSSASEYYYINKYTQADIEVELGIKP